MAQLKISWTQTAVKQRNYTFGYWNNRNKSKKYSRKLNQKIKAQIELLKNNPELGKKTDFKETRTISMGHYSIFYKKVNFQIIITGFWDNRRDPKKLFAFLKRG